MSTGKSEDFVSVGDRFRKEREKLHLTQKQLASRLATTEKTIIGYEGGGTMPKLAKLVLFHGLGADLLYILVGDQSMDSEASTPASKVAVEISRLDLGEDDARLLVNLAKRMASH